LTVENRGAQGGYVVVCDHAVSTIPERYGTLGLDTAARDSHIAWDPGALPVSRALSKAFDAPLIFPGVSRLIIDCNRAPSHAGSIVTISENTPVPGNVDISGNERALRERQYYLPFHAEIDKVLDRCIARGVTPSVIAIHSFTPVYKGKARPWHIGILSNGDRRLADALLKKLGEETDLIVGDNEPYSAADGVYHTLERHAEGRGLPCVMVEIRNDLVATAAGQNFWSQRILHGLESIAHFVP
jgi:predicted N-formylglutamate amidohydrolase